MYYLKSCSLPKPLSLSNLSLFGAQEIWRARKRKSDTEGLQEAVCSARLLGLFPELISDWCPAMQSRDDRKVERLFNFLSEGIVFVQKCVSVIVRECALWPLHMEKNPCQIEKRPGGKHEKQ